MLTRKFIASSPVQLHLPATNYYIEMISVCVHCRMNLCFVGDVILSYYAIRWLSKSEGLCWVLTDDSISRVSIWKRRIISWETLHISIGYTMYWPIIIGTLAGQLYRFCDGLYSSLFYSTSSQPVVHQVFRDCWFWCNLVNKTRGWKSIIAPFCRY